MNIAELEVMPPRYRYLVRIFEIIPGLVSWSFLATPIVLSFTHPVAAAYLIIAFDLLWSTRFVGFGFRLVRGYSRMRRVNSADWQARLGDLTDLSAAIQRVNQILTGRSFSLFKRLELREYRARLIQARTERVSVLREADIYHGIIIVAYNEPAEIVEGTVKSLLKSTHPLKKLWLFIGYEERGGEHIENVAKALIQKYGHYFAYAQAVKHPQNIPGEIKAKAGNMNAAARQLRDYATKQGIKPEHVIVTTLDSDNRPDPNYFSHLTFVYATTANRTRRSYQPMAMFFNNIWSASAPMRIVAAANSFWLFIESTRPHRLRNFSAHAQSLQTLIDTNYWNVRSIVEDGHQYWRTYYRYDGDHKVIPLYVPIYQDVVLAKTFWRSFKTQFKQLQRWAYGVSDTPFIVVNNLRNKKIAFSEKWWLFIRQFEGYFSWATASLILALAAWLPLWLNRAFTDQALAHQLPVIVSRIHQITLIGLLISATVSFMSLPPRPAGYARWRLGGMVLQWVLLPVVFIVFHSAAALNAQTRLALGFYLTKFNVTEKAIIPARPKKAGRP